ncbi:MAG: hypothetical protein ABWK53_08275 [Anaerolineales bacterium]
MEKRRLRSFGLVLLLALFAVGAPASSAQAQTQTPVVTVPQAGQVLQGMVTILGSSAVENFLAFEVAFAYAGDSTGTWFLIAASSQPVSDGVLAVWDTTAITDGEYDLRLRVFLNDGSALDVIVAGLRVRNYTPLDTPTPTATPPPTETPVLLTPVLPTATPFPTATPSPFPTPTLLPTNPAVLPTVEVYRSAAYGALLVLSVFSLLGVYSLLRRK